MKNNMLKYYIAAFYLCSTVTLFAQPGAEENNGGLESADPPVAAIDDYVWILAAIGLIYVFFRFRAFAQQEKN
jgi:hypothetical protein